MAGTTGLEPATSAVTGQRSNQLSYVPRLFFNNLAVCPIDSSVSQVSPFSLASTFSLSWTQFLAFRTPNGPQNRHAATGLSLSDVRKVLRSIIGRPSVDEGCRVSNGLTVQTDPLPPIANPIPAVDP